MESGAARTEQRSAVGYKCTARSRIIVRPARWHLHQLCGPNFAAIPPATLAASSRGSPSRTIASATTATDRRKSPPGPTPSGGGPNGSPDDEPSTSDSFQIGLDPFSQQLILSALTAGAASTIAAWAHIDLSSIFRVEGGSLAVALELSAPVLVLLLVVAAPRWAPPFKGSELERLRHNYYMTAQVLELYLDFDDDDQEDGDGGSSSGDEGSGGSERARVKRRLRLEQTVGWAAISSGLALVQAFTLQPWNPPTANSVFGLALAGRTAWQLSNEFLVRGVGWGLLSTWVAGALSSADMSDGILFFGKVFGGQDTVTYAAGLALVALALPGALWEARAARNFVRASVVGPVRDAAIFCTGNGVDEPAYCDPAGFAMMAARRPANMASVATVVTRTRAWRSGPESSFTSVSSLSSMDAVAVDEELLQQQQQQQSASTSGTSAGTSSPASSSPPSSTASPSSPAHTNPPSPPSASSSTTAASSSSSPSPTPSRSPATSDGSPSSSAPTSSSPPPPPPASSSPSPSPASSTAMPSVGPTVSASSTAFEWDSEDMGVLLRVETLQDKLAFSAALYYQLLTAFAINGSFLASDRNLLASFAAAWLLRTGPLLLAELRARSAAAAAGAS